METIIEGKNGNQRFLRSKETSDLINALEAVPVGETITYEQLSAIAHGDVRGRCRGNLVSARRYLENEKHILFGTVIDKGLKRASDAESIMEAEKTLPKIRRAARRGANKAVCVQDFGALPPDMQTRHNTTLSMLGAISLATSASKIKAVQSAVSAAKDRLAIGQTLDLFSK